MSRTNPQIAGIIVGHLSDILGGKCSITRDQIEQVSEDIGMSEILSGLYFLNQDLELRQQERLHAEGELKAAVQRLEEQNKELEQSRAAIAAFAAELSTPVIRVWDKVLMVPVIGRVDSARAADMMDRLLNAVVQEKAHYIILDLTGVANIDAGTADGFVGILRAVALLGAKGIVAGIPPEVSLAIVSLGIDLAGIKTVQTVQSALLYCMRDGGRW